MDFFPFAISEAVVRWAAGHGDLRCRLRCRLIGQSRWQCGWHDAGVLRGYVLWLRWLSRLTVCVFECFL